MANTITFMSKDLSKEGMNHNKALHITMIREKSVNGFSWQWIGLQNVCPFKITTCLGYQQKSFAILGQAIRAYDKGGK